jgi:beta-mannosidase
MPAIRELSSAMLAWRLLRSEAGSIPSADDLPSPGQGDWIDAPVPGTVAMALHAQQGWNWDCPPDLDDHDWWYVCDFEADADEDWDRLCFDGLATLCEIWLNGERLGQTDNQFRQHEWRLTQPLGARNRLVLCFRSLNRALAERRPRPGWKTRLVSHQNLRWFRTTLLGRIPGWSPPLAPVGPWRAITLRSARHPRYLQAIPRLESGRASLTLRMELPACSAAVEARLVFDGRSRPLTLQRLADGWLLDNRIDLPEAEAWLPHTHGEPRLYEAHLELSIDGEMQRIDLPALGFREIGLDCASGAFSLRVNGLPVFCRGACWTVNDIVSLDGDPQRLRDTLELMRQAGANMIRIGGTMLYEQTLFYALCDELGILVWQDFMFANMDYPDSDADFVANVEAEVSGQLRRLSAHACIAVYCGNSEVEQQAVMMGVAPSGARNPIFHQLIPQWLERHHPGVPYVPSTPWSERDDQLPFRSDRGLSHYYGIGAYQRPLTELRSHDVRFTPETLGFANVPGLAMRKTLFNQETAIMHHPLWKRRSPRDANAGWDFEDVRDHYLGQLLSIDPVRLRYEDPARYWRVSEFISGEVMQRAFAEWRSVHSRCRGALVWFLKDLWPGAGWGIIDSEGNPKSAWYALRRCWQPRGLCITDESLNGLGIHVYNEAASPLRGRLKLRVFSPQGACLLEAEDGIEVAARSTLGIEATQLVGRFFDLTYAYRFGPLAHQLVSVELLTEAGQSLWAHYLPEPRLPPPVDASMLEAHAERQPSGAVLLRLSAQRLIYGLHVEAKGYRSSDNDFHLAPGQRAEVLLQPLGEPPARFSCMLEALNLEPARRLRLDS